MMIILGRLLANNELARMWKEAVVVYFKVLSWYLSGGTEDEPDNFVMIVYLRIVIWTQDLPNTKQERISSRLTLQLSLLL
jgi:hypothetical protein